MTNFMQILHVIASVNPAQGGPIEGITQIQRVLVPQGHHAEIVSLDAPDAPWVAACPLPVHALGPSKLGYRWSPRFVPFLREIAPRFDAVVVNGLWQWASFGAWRALRGIPTPYFVYTHGMLDPWFKRTYPLKHLKKCLYWRWGEFRVLRDAARVCFTCDEERLLARQSFRPYVAREAVVNYGTAGPPPNADADAQQNAFFARFPALTNKRLILFLSRIHVKKGCDLLLDAFAAVASQHKTLHLVMAGPDGSGWQKELTARAAKLGIAERVTWTGMLTGDEKWGAFRAADAFALPSHQENFGIVVAEALACGTPVLISNKVNIWREIDEGGAGFVEGDTTAGATRLLERWLALTDAEKTSMRGRARQCFLRHFEIRNAAQSLVDVLQSGGAK